MINLSIQIDDIESALEIRKVLSDAAWQIRHEAPGTAAMLEGVRDQIVAQMWEPQAAPAPAPYIPGGCTECNDSLVGDEPAGATVCSRCHDYDADDEAEEDASETLANDLIAVVWPVLDRNAGDRDEIMCAIHNVIDAWEPQAAPAAEEASK